VAAIGAEKKPLPHFNDASFDFQSLGVYDRVRDFFSRGFDDIAEGLP
jgi:hypothetical protein